MFLFFVVANLSYVVANSVSDKVKLLTQFAVTSLLNGSAAHIVRSKGANVVANYVSNKRVGCSRSSQQQFTFHSAAHAVRSNGAIVVANYVSDKRVMLLTKLAATGSLFGKAAHKVCSNGFCSRELCERQK